MRWIFTSYTAPPVIPNPPWSVVGIINTGQSLSNGAVSVSGMFVTQSYSNLMVHDAQTQIWAGTSHTYPANTYMTPGASGNPGGSLFHTVAGGTGGGSIPSWNTALGSTTTDGGITWTVVDTTTNPLNATGSYLTLQPYVIPSRAGVNGGSYPDNLQGQQLPGPIMATITNLALKAGASSYVLLGSDVGIGGNNMAMIQKGGVNNPYSASIYEATIGQNIVHTVSGSTFGYGAVFLTHGEADWNTSNYDALVTTLQQNYNADLKAITGQSQNIPMFVTQQCSTPMTQDGLVPSPTYYPISALKLLSACNASPANLIMVGSKYQYPYLQGSQHMQSQSYDQQGEKYAQAYVAVAEKKAWLCTQPTGFSAASGSNSVVINFQCMFPPLRFDTSIGLNHQVSASFWANGMGFEAYDRLGNLPITASISGPKQVTLQLGRAADTGLAVQYALTTDSYIAQAGSCDKSGPYQGHFGNLTDSDPFVGPFTGKANTNFCVLFQQKNLT